MYGTASDATRQFYGKALGASAERLALGYLRVSREAMAAADRFGLAAQREAIAQYADVNNIRVLEYREEHESGASTTRPTWNDIINGRDPGCNCVIVAKADRVSRDAEYFYYSKYILKNQGVELLSANSAEDLSALGPFAPMMEAIIVSFAQFERQRINERMTGGRIVKARGGGYSGGNMPYGYRSDGRHGLEEHPGEIDTLRLVRSMRKDGASLKDIASRLEREGRKTRTGHTQWQLSTLSQICSNSFYDGIYTYAGVSAPSQYGALT